MSERTEQVRVIAPPGSIPAVTVVTATVIHVCACGDRVTIVSEADRAAGLSGPGIKVDRDVRPTYLGATDGHCSSGEIRD
ncbi:MAG: hypothetical protein RL338_1948 [Chloroflexota bacterium]|jgi:hypothetical protein